MHFLKYFCILVSVIFLLCFHGCANTASPVHPQLLNFFLIYSARDFQPVHITNAGDGSNRLFITDIMGRIMIYKNGRMLDKPFLDMRHYLKKGEIRLVSVAFHPNYKKNRTFFIYYTDLLGTIYLARFFASTTDPDSAMIESGVILYSATSQTGRVHHHGGDIHFGKDGYLYLATGYMDKQGDPSRQAQNMKLPFGKMLRFDVNVNQPPFYKLPSDNPFIHSHDTLPEIWASGLRNPWRFCFNEKNGDLWIADVGQNKYEEIHFRRFSDPPGANFGWSCYEADSSFDLTNCMERNKYVFPVFSYVHNYKTGNSITGGVVYHGNVYPSLKDCYICADFDSDEAWLIKENGDSFLTYHQATAVPTSIVGFGEDESGEVYAAVYSGKIYKVTAGGLNISSINDSAAIVTKYNAAQVK